jgi:hypothetical protein
MQCGSSLPLSAREAYFATSLHYARGSGIVKTSSGEPPHSI